MKGANPFAPCSDGANPFAPCGWGELEKPNKFSMGRIGLFAPFMGRIDFRKINFMGRMRIRPINSPYKNGDHGANRGVGFAVSVPHHQSPSQV